MARTLEGDGTPLGSCFLDDGKMDSQLHSAHYLPGRLQRGSFAGVESKGHRDVAEGGKSRGGMRNQQAVLEPMKHEGKRSVCIYTTGNNIWKATPREPQVHGTGTHVQVRAVRSVESANAPGLLWRKEDHPGPLAPLLLKVQGPQVYLPCQ